MGSIKKLLLAIAAMLCVSSGVRADEISVKTNVLYDATLSLALGAELQVAPQWSVELTGSYNGWDVAGNKWRHWVLQPEGRFWLKGDMKGHFFSANALVGQANVGSFKWGILGDRFQNSRFQGWVSGAGLGYGYAWRLSDNWKLELEIAVGVLHFEGDRISSSTNRTIERGLKYTYFAPTKAAVSFAYCF